MTRVRGLWFDGPSEAVPVLVEPLGKVLRVVDTDGRERGEAAYEGGALSIGGTDGCHLVVTHGERALYVEREGLLPALEGTAPEWFVSQVRALQTERRVRWVTTRTLLLSGAGLVLALAVLLLVNLHALAVAAVPVSWEESIGGELWAGYEGEERVAPEVRDLVARITSRLDATHRRVLAERGETSPYTIRVKVVPDPEVNAFALPGGYLIVNQGLIAEATSPEEVAGVLGHELGHVAGRHVVRSAVQEVGTLTLLLLVFDPGTALTQIKPLLNLVGLKFSRDQESDADAFGARLLHASGLDPAAASTFFDRLARKELAGTEVLSVIGTHPPSAARAAALRKLVDELPPLPRGEPIVPHEDWPAIKAAAAR